MVNLAADIGENNLQTLEKIFIKSTPFIQSDHQKIRALAKKIIGNHSLPLEKVRKLVDWVHQNIEKRPVISLPDALTTLENRVGDCNEHAVLMAALARAAGIPCRVEAGLVYLKGRFYYHAWNLVYLGRWITVDALFDQIPADVSHIRFVTGSPDRQLDLIGIIGKIQLRVIE
jgi:transglutaminase-like putative cysteine protease